MKNDLLLMSFALKQKELRSELHLEFIGLPLTSVQQRGLSKREARKRKKLELELDRTLGAFVIAKERKLPMGTQEEAVSSVVSILLPLLLRWLLSALSKKAIEWLWVKSMQSRGSHDPI